MVAFRVRFTRMSWSDTFKFGLGLLFGLSLSRLTYPPHLAEKCTKELCHKICKDEARPRTDLLMQRDTDMMLFSGYKPHTLYDVLRYDLFNESVIMNNFDDAPLMGLLGHHKQDLKDIIDQTLYQFNSGKAERWQFKRLMNGYRRYDPIRGEEYLLHMEISRKENVTELSQHTFEMVKPFARAHIISHSSADLSSTKIHFILSIHGVTGRFHRFMKNYEEVCLETNEAVGLILVVFTEAVVEEDSDVMPLRKSVQDLLKKYPTADIRIVLTQEKFSRGVGIDIGARQLDGNSLMFFCDVDVQIHRDALSRCRLNSIRDKQVYYPIVFSQYHPEAVNKYSPEGKVKNLMDVNRYTGFWVHYGFGMACMYKADYRSVGGFNLTIQGWGGEDVDLYLKHVKSSIQVFRAVDPGLIHIYHGKSCSSALTLDQMRMCVDSKADSIGSKQQLGKLVAAQNMMN